METAFPHTITPATPRFKSYYVVWKQAMVEGEGEEDKKFKSYYVVWKLNDQDKNESGAGGFKSYYVVWKLVKISVVADINF